MTEGRRCLTNSGVERGSVLLLIPAGLLVMLMLGSMTADRMIVVQSQRELVVLAQAAAADAIEVGVDLDRLRGSGELRWDTRRIAATLTNVCQTADPAIQVRWAFDGTRLTVWLRRRVRLVFAPSASGDRSAVVTARASALLPRR